MQRHAVSSAIAAFPEIAWWAHRAAAIDVAFASAQVPIVARAQNARATDTDLVGVAFRGCDTARCSTSAAVPS